MTHHLSETDLSEILTEDAVANYLKQHPNFLRDRPQLLAEMDLPHHSGDSTVSLVERQVNILRERNIIMRHRLSELLVNARRNDQLFEKTRALLMHLLEARSKVALIESLFSALTNDFNIPMFRLLLVAENHQPSVKDSRLKFLSQSQLNSAPLKSILSQTKATCGQLSQEEYDALFDNDARKIGSVVITPLTDNHSEGVGHIALANEDVDYYRSSTDTLFLNFLSAVFTRLYRQL